MKFYKTKSLIQCHGWLVVDDEDDEDEDEDAEILYSRLTYRSTTSKQSVCLNMDLGPDFFFSSGG